MPSVDGLVILNEGHKLAPETKKAAKCGKCAERTFKVRQVVLPPSVYRVSAYRSLTSFEVCPVVFPVDFLCHSYQIVGSGTRFLVRVRTSPFACFPAVYPPYSLPQKNETWSSITPQRCQMRKISANLIIGEDIVIDFLL